MSYLPCELHCHTVHSDGRFQVEELLNAAKDNHLSLIALTDHNTVSGYAELNDSITPAIRGIEWTTYFGHMLVLGVKGFVDWRNAVPDNIDEKISEIKACDGVVGIAHPFQIGSPIVTGGRWQFNVKDWANVDYIEIWHEDINKISNENDRALEMWTSLLDKGFKIAAVYGRDWHAPGENGHFGCTYIDIDGDINEENALAAIRAGRTVASTGAKFFLSLERDGNTYSIGDSVSEGEYKINLYTDLHSRQKDAGEESVIYKSVRIVSNGGKIVYEGAIGKKELALTLEKGYWYRAELWGTVDGDSHPLAITSAVYCR